MNKKIIWQYYNPKEALEEVWQKQVQEDDEDESWKEPKAMTMPPLIDNPFTPKDYWIGHTNFKLNQNHHHILDYMVDGVEAFKFLSNYRLVICVGEAFEWKNVRLDVEKLLCDRHVTYTDDEEVNKNIQKTKTILSKYQYWIMYVLPNGKIFTAASNVNDDVFKVQVQSVMMLSKDINGILIESDSCKNKS